MMKKITVLLLTLTLPLAHAMPASRAKVINVKEWTSNNAKVTFHVKPLLKADLDDSNTKYMSVVASTKPQNGSAMTPSTFTANDDVYLYNDTDQTQDMYFTVSVCIDTKDGQPIKNFNSQCGYHTETVSMPMRSTFVKHLSPELIVSFPEAGKYHLQTYAFAFASAEISPLERSFRASSGSELTVTN